MYCSLTCEVNWHESFIQLVLPNLIPLLPSSPFLPSYSSSLLNTWQLENFCLAGPGYLSVSEMETNLTGSHLIRKPVRLTRSLQKPKPPLDNIWVEIILWTFWWSWLWWLVLQGRSSEGWYWPDLTCRSYQLHWAQIILTSGQRKNKTRQISVKLISIEMLSQLASWGVWTKVLVLVLTDGWGFPSISWLDWTSSL